MSGKHNKTLATIIFSSLVFGVLATAMSVISLTTISSYDTRSFAKGKPTSNSTGNNTQTMNLTVGQRLDIKCDGWNLQGHRKGRTQISVWCEAFPGKGGPFTTPGTSPGARGQQNRPANPGQGKNAQPTP